MTIKGVEFNLTLFPPSGVRDATKLGLKAYKSFLAMRTVTKDWVPEIIHDKNGHLLTDYQTFQTTAILLEQKDDQKQDHP